MFSKDSSEPKKKRARSKGWSNAQNTPAQEIGTDSQGEEMVGKEVVSRSGRKIKPKRFADFSSSDEFDVGMYIIVLLKQTYKYIYLYVYIHITTMYRKICVIQKPVEEAEVIKAKSMTRWKVKWYYPAVFLKNN